MVILGEWAFSYEKGTPVGFGNCLLGRALDVGGRIVLSVDDNLMTAMKFSACSHMWGTVHVVILSFFGKRNHYKNESQLRILKYTR